MATGTRIPTPMKHRWRRFRYNVLPVASFIGCVAVTLWLWEKQGQLPNVVGEVEAVRLLVAASADGKLLALSQKPWTLFDKVKESDMLGRLDDGPARALLASYQAEAITLAKELQAAAGQIRLEEVERQHDRERERRRAELELAEWRLEAFDRRAQIDTEELASALQAEQRHRRAIGRKADIEREILRLESEVERLRLEKMDRQLTINEDTMARQQHDANVELLKSVQKKRGENVVSKAELNGEQMLRDAVKKRIKDGKNGLDEVETQLEEAQHRRDEYKQQSSKEIELFAGVEQQWNKSQQRLKKIQAETLANVEKHVQQAEQYQDGSRREIEKIVEEKTKALNVVLELQERQGGGSSSPTFSLATLLEPIRAEMDTQQALIRELELQIDALEIRAPIAGTICAIYCWPGQFVRRGDPIITLAADEGRYAVAYIRQEQRIRPKLTTPVYVRARLPGSRMEKVKIERIGPQFEEIPPHLLQDVRVLEWGRPVRIALPVQFPVSPGELIDIRFGSLAGKDPG